MHSKTDTSHVTRRKSCQADITTGKQRAEVDGEQAELTGVADVEAFSSVGMIGLKLQSHDVSIGRDLRWNVFSRKRPKSRRLRQT